ncbi:glycoside hydrolase family 76 protein [Arthrobacter bambusae]|uniref:glycoside hydrolase family 76 protein n=1 Tax=Arthrobacter bambusae TaxID=1338426 RepID=UPI00277DFBA5|nr:glycoside hydrolase family 76 protein [Arthrobacter bambusae]MDQ0032131.1 putative alpha-1,6-mannanase (GH76 family) [Arthrobacter bambusae]MDQ0100263.1 putative alpha-1,6-mannanase (GH76 family) [Arthrobacter bambusae]
MSAPDARPGTPETPDWAARANRAALSVTRHFGRPLLFLPGTHLAASVLPSKGFPRPFQPWNYWWQAHYVDCLVDAGLRELASGSRFDGGDRPSAGALASRLVTTIRLRNFLRYVNSYYDDMAWLALATLRLDGLAEQAHKPGRRRNARLQETLSRQFESASTDDLGGGTFWSTKRDFKNTPATAPVALHFARTGTPQRAQGLLDWLDATLFDPTTGLYLDGVRIQEGKLVLAREVYTYNQGPVFGALLELGGDANLARAAALVGSIAEHLTVRGPETQGKLVLRGEGTGDGGLFTGILVRYLALAAADERLAAPIRATAGQLVLDTAEALWAGRTTRSNAANRTSGKHDDGGWLVFSTEPQRPAAETYPAGTGVELSTQLQGWMVLEAAARIR